MKKRIFSIVIITFMVLAALTACGTNQTNASASPTAANSPIVSAPAESIAPSTDPIASPSPEESDAPLASPSNNPAESDHSAILDANVEQAVGLLESTHNMIAGLCVSYQTANGSMPTSTDQLFSFIGDNMSHLKNESITVEISNNSLITIYTSSSASKPFKLTTNLGTLDPAAINGNVSAQKDYPSEYTGASMYN